MKHMKKLIALALVAISILAIAVPAMATQTGVYNTGAVHLRSTPGGASLGLVSRDATCDILAEQNQGGYLWYKVRITSHTLNNPDLYNIVGWSQARFITTSGGGSTPDGRPTNAEEAFGYGILENGSVGNAVRNVQLCLKNNPYHVYSGNIDGDFGDLTETAVRTYQTRKGISADGKVGRVTRSHLWSDYETLLRNRGY